MGNDIAGKLSKDGLSQTISKTEADARARMNARRRPNKLIQRGKEAAAAVAAAVGRKGGRANKLVQREKEAAAKIQRVLRIQQHHSQVQVGQLFGKL